MEPGLVLSLAAFFQVNFLMLCRSEEDDPALAEARSLISRDFRGKYIQASVKFEEVAAVLESDEFSKLPVMIVCQDADFSTLPKPVSPSLFRKEHIWLLEDSAILENQLQNLPLSLKSNFLTFCSSEASFEVTETFKINSIKSHILKENYFGNWTFEGGLTVPNPRLWERRSDLSGVELLNTVKNFKFVNNLDTDNLTATGMMPDVLHLLQASLNFR